MDMIERLSRAIKDELAKDGFLDPEWGGADADCMRYAAAVLKALREPTQRVIYPENLTKQEIILMNFKVAVKNAIDTLIAVATGDSPKDVEVRKLGVAMELCSKGEALKKKAKETLKELGVIKDEYAASTEEIAFDSPKFTMTAKTNAGSQYLDATKISAAMMAEGLAMAKINRILQAATSDKKPSTSFKVEQK